MLYEFKSNMVKELNNKQEEYVKNKKNRYTFKNKSRIDSYKVAEAVDKASVKSIKSAVVFAGLTNLMD